MSKRVLFFCTAVLCLLPHSISVAGSGSYYGPANFSHVSTADLDHIFSRFNRPHTPGCAVGVVSGDSLIFSKGYGMANLDYGLPIHPRSRFMIASVSKQVAAACLLMMEQENLLDPGEDIRKYIPELAGLSHAVTARQIMHHTSGIPDLYHLLILADIGLDDTTTAEEALTLLSRQKSLNFTPGSEHLYSNSGYFLISVLVKNITGMTLQEYSRRHFFEPLGMSSTHWHDDTGMIVPNRVISYLPTEEGPGQFYRGNLERVGARGLFTTIEDFARWDANFRNNRTALESFRQKMTRIGYTRRGEVISYASGLRVGRYKGLQTIGHAGSYMGFRTQHMQFPALDFSVIVFCNMSNIAPETLARRVADLYLQEHFDRQFSAYPGRYRNEPMDLAFEVVADRGEVYLYRGEERLHRMSWVANDRFRAGDWEIRFLRTGNQPPSSFSLQAPHTGRIIFHRE